MFDLGSDIADRALRHRRYGERLRETSSERHVTHVTHVTHTHELGSCGGAKEQVVRIATRSARAAV